MPKSKYDWAALKHEFFESDIDEIESFLDKKGIKGKVNGKWTKGRAKEKQAHKAKIVEEAIAINARKKAKELQVPLEEIMKGKMDIIKLLLHQVSKYVQDSNDEKKRNKDIDVGNAEKILRMFKTELGEPSTIGTNYNLNANKVEGLSEEELQALDILFGGNQPQKKRKSTD